MKNLATLPRAAALHHTPWLAVGSEPTGDGRWGHSDLAGGMSEWTLDWFALGDWYLATETGCSDCAGLQDTISRVLRGGAWDGDAAHLRAAARGDANPDDHAGFVGLRCARTL